jgi:hypothetical protein
VAALYTDHNVDQRIAIQLRHLGHYVVTAPMLGLQRAGDDEHLLAAAQHSWILVTHDWKDFSLLHDAWRRWAQAWRATPVPQHAGILVIPQPWPAPDAAQEIDRFIQSNPPLANVLYRHHRTRGWERRP